MSTRSMSTDQMHERGRAIVDHAPLRAAAALLLAGQLLYILVTQFHAGGEANKHDEIFATYARDESWKAVHVGQFLAMSAIVAGLVVLHYALTGPDGRAPLVARLGAGSAVVALALYAGLQAVDGIGNKEVDDAWVAADAAEKAGRFASAEAMRWLEWGLRSYHNYALGLALLLVAAGVVRTMGLPKPAAYFMGLSGVAYLAQGWVVGAEGFSGTNTTLILAAWVLSLVWMIWLAVSVWRRQPSGDRRLAE